MVQMFLAAVFAGGSVAAPAASHPSTAAQPPSRVTLWVPFLLRLCLPPSSSSSSSSHWPSVWVVSSCLSLLGLENQHQRNRAEDPQQQTDTSSFLRIPGAPCPQSHVRLGLYNILGSNKFTPILNAAAVLSGVPELASRRLFQRLTNSPQNGACFIWTCC